MKDKLYLPYVVVSPQGLYYVGLHDSVLDCWTVALGWPDESEIKEYEKNGWYCAEATISWKDPRKQSAIPNS